MIVHLSTRKPVFASHLPPNNPQAFSGLLAPLTNFCESRALREKREKREKSLSGARVNSIQKGARIFICDGLMATHRPQIASKRAICTKHIQVRHSRHVKMRRSLDCEAINSTWITGVAAYRDKQAKINQVIQSSPRSSGRALDMSCNLA